MNDTASWNDDPDYDKRPLTFRIKWQNGQWWCYSKGYPRSFFSSERLDWMCDAIAHTFPKVPR